MKELSEIIKLLPELGVTGILIVILILIVLEPTRAEKLKALLFLPTFRFFRWGSKQYLGAKVGGTVTEFLKHYIGHSLSSTVAPRIQIRWVSSISDSVLTEDGTVILCMEDSNDQTKNILTATRLVLPAIICPTLRSNIDKCLGAAIDLTVLQKLSDGLGKYARPLFQRHFLAPEVDSEKRIADLFTKLVEIDSKGLFVFIFMEELNLLGERLFHKADLTNKTTEIERFLEFLLTIARRDPGENIETSYASNEFKVGIIFLAKTAKALSRGIVPYLKAVDFNISHGCDSIYLVGFLPSSKTFHRTIDALNSDNRVFIEKQTQVRITSDPYGNFINDHMDLALARVIRYVSDATFQERVEAAAIREGMRADGVLLDVLQDSCVIDIRNLRCNLKRIEASWNHLSSCTEVFSPNENISVIVKHIDIEKGQIEVSRRLPEDDPWQKISPPEPGSTLEIVFFQREGKFFFGKYAQLIEVTVPVEELTWLGADAVRDEDFIGSTANVQIINVDAEQHMIFASIRLLESNPWPEIHKRYPKNTELRGVVCQVNNDYVIVKLQDGLVGHIPAESMRKAGFEFADFENSVVTGQGLDVVVTKVFLGEKKRIRLDLKRNLEIA